MLRRTRAAVAVSARAAALEGADEGLPLLPAPTVHLQYQTFNISHECTFLGLPQTEDVRHKEIADRWFYLEFFGFISVTKPRVPFHFQFGLG